MRKSLIKVLTSAIAVSALLLGGITPAFSIEGADSAAAEISAETPAAKTEQKPDSGAKAAGSVHETAGPQSERAAKSAADTANKAAEPKPETRNEKTETAAVQNNSNVLTVNTGFANWDFRRSFRDYVGRTWNTALKEGENRGEHVKVLTSGNNELLWSPVPGQTLDLTGKTGMLKLQGKVSWRKYGGILDLWITNPTIDFKKGLLLADGYTAGTMAKEGKVEFKQKEIAELKDLKIERKNNTVIVSALKTVLSSNVKSLVGFYENEPGAPFVMTIPADGNAENVQMPVLWELFPENFKNPKVAPEYSDAPIQVLQIPDKELEKCIRFETDLVAGLPITNKTIEGIFTLKCASRGIKNLEGLQHGLNLNTVDFYNNQITDLTPLTGLPKLREVIFGKNKLVSLKGLEKSPKIETIEAEDNWITDVSAVGVLPKIDKLILTNNRISNLSQLKWDREIEKTGVEKENIHKIDLSHNRIADLSVMKDLPIMLDLNLSHNLIEDLGTLPQKNAVHKLNLEHNFIKDPNPLTAGAITALLRSLKINYNSFTDWSALKEKFDKEFDDNGYSSERLGKIIRHFPADAAEAQTLLNPKTIEQVRAENNQLDKNVTDFFAQLKQQNDAKKDDPKQNDAKKDDPKQNDAKKDNPKQNTLVPMLNWGLKASFRKYVSGNFAHGKWELSEGAAGEFTFPIKDAAAFDLNKLQDLQFAGKVHFTAHNGLLDMTISNPRIVNNNQGRQLIATMSYLPFDQKNIHAILSGKQNPAADESKRVTATVALAELSEPQITGEGAAKKIHFADVNLTADGAKAFANFYDEGQALDPITITFTAGGEKPNRTGNGESEKQIQPQPQAPPQPQLQPQPPTQHEQLQKCEADPHKKRITNGSLSWALRSSFTSYLRGPIAHGKWDLAGASWDGAQFSFPATGGRYNTATRTGKIYYSGSVHFTGHNGVLDIRISSPALVINGNTASLYMNVSGSDMSGNKFSLGRVNFATVTFNGIKVTDSRLSFSGAAVRLTADGAKAFAGFYKAGEKLAPMSSSVALVSATTCDKDGNLVEYDAFGNTLARTGAAAGNLIIWSLLIALMGAGILTPAYRRRKNIYQAENA